VTATITIQTESLGTFPDVTAEVLDRVLSQLDADNAYVILERSDRAEAYAQAAIARDKNANQVAGRFVVEYRDGPNAHWQAFTEDIERVRDVLAGWAFDRPGWKELLTWEVLDLGF